jgi:hypothetical protein
MAKVDVGDDGTCAAQDAAIYKSGGQEAVQALHSRARCSMAQILRLLGVPEREVARWDCGGDRKRACAFDAEALDLAWRYGRNARIPPGGKKRKAAARKK